MPAVIEIYAGAFDATARNSINAHLADLDNPHEVSKADVGLGNVDNTSDAAKPLSDAAIAALALKAPLASPALTGTPTAPTAALGTVTTQIATTAFAQAAANAVQGDVDGVIADLAAHLADLDNPHEVNKTDVGLGNADNTSDANKPISTATQLALNALDINIEAVEADLATHEADVANPHEVTKAQVGLGNADNTSDANKPVSTAQQTALNLKANLASPTLTGTPAAPTAAPGADTTQIATTAFVTAAAALVSSTTATALALKANIASPALTGVPTSTTASPGDNSVRIATTAFVAAADALKANIASPTFTGIPAAPTAAPGTNTTQLATAAFVNAAAVILAAATAAAQADADQALLDALPVPSLVAALRADRPGDAVRLYGETKTGAPSAVTGIDPTWVTTSAAGSVVRVDGTTADDPQTIAPTAAYSLEDGKVYDIRYKVQRQTDPADPLNDSVTLGIRWLQNSKAGVVSGGETTVENMVLVVADGIEERIARVSMAARADVDYVAPAGTIYFRPFIDLYGGTGVTDIIAIHVTPVVLEIEVPFLAPGSQPAQSLFQRFFNLNAGYVPGMVRWGINVASVAEITTPIGLQIGYRTGEGEQIDGAIYIDRDMPDDAAGHSAHGLTDQSRYAREGGAYASLDVKVDIEGTELAHFVGGQARPRFNGPIHMTEYVHGWNTLFSSEDPGAHADLLAHFAAGADANWAGTMDFQAGFISGSLDKATDNWAFYTTQNRSRFRGITSFFGTTVGDDLAWNWFGDEDTGFCRMLPNTFSIITGGFHSLDITTTGLSSVGSTGVTFFQVADNDDSFIRDDRVVGVTRFHTINAATGVSATGTVASIGTRNADSVNAEIALLAAGTDFTTLEWLVQNGCALRSGTDLDGGMSIAILAGDFRIYTGGPTLAMTIDASTQQLTYSADMIWEPAASVDSLPVNGQFTIEATSNTQAKLVFRGSDGTTRKSAAITLS